MSENARGKKQKAQTQRVDARVRRTRHLLGGALWELLQEKPLDTITVQQVLDRAGVGRSTFYGHYSDKEDLFISDIEEFLEHMTTMLSRRAEPSDRVAPVREFLAHVAEARQIYDSLVASGRLHDFNGLAKGYFARAIDQRLTEIPRGRNLPAAERPAVANALAGALMSLVYWWIDRDMPGSPEQIDELYHRMVWDGLD